LKIFENCLVLKKVDYKMVNFMDVKTKVYLKISDSAIYSESFKKQVVAEFESGRWTKNDLQRKYSIGGNSTVLKWCKKYGKFEYCSPPQIALPLKDQQLLRIKELEKKLKEAEFKLMVYDKLIEVTNRQLDKNTLKKIEARLSESLQQLPKEE
jgi:transposase